MLSLADAPARPTPKAVALIQGDKRWTWGQFDRRSAAWAARLRERVHAIVEADADLPLATLREFLTAHLSRDKHPRSLEILSDPVRDDAGKARKALLKETPE